MSWSRKRKRHPVSQIKKYGQERRTSVRQWGDFIMPTKLANKKIRNKSNIRDEALASRHIPYTRMVDHNTIKTRDGAFMQVLQVDGWPFETTDDDQVDALKVLKNTIYRGIASPTTAIYTHVIRRKTKVKLNGEMPDRFSEQLSSKYEKPIRRSLIEKKHCVKAPGR